LQFVADCLQLVALHHATSCAEGALPFPSQSVEHQAPVIDFRKSIDAVVTNAGLEPVELAP
jgi:hypothetical protein